MNEKIFRIGIIYWGGCAGLLSMLGNTLVRAGCEVSFLQHDEKLDRTLDVIIAFGPFGSLVPVADQLLAMSPIQRPLFVLWMTEQFPNPNLPKWIHYTGGNARSYAERLANKSQFWGLSWSAAFSQLIKQKGLRYRYYGDIHWLQQKGLLSLLVVGSQWIADFLRPRGFTPLVGYYNFASDWGDDLALERDIPVLWLGKMGTDRRRNCLQQVRAELKKRGIEVVVIDGNEHPYVFGEERTNLLNRTKITINILRQEWDNHSMRYYLAASNGVLIVTEPTFPHIPFVPGKHLVETPIKQMADTICYYLANEEKRVVIANCARHLATMELMADTAVSQILEQIILLKQNAPSNGYL